ncbi:YbhB/YbcL family Raf kinase inhibitor-like protein [Shimia sagamensis]|uniref:Phospholipid-binding protein n=1 Tax=Shimia sagamensis TaxID=1566352 RepID=A0ABY1N5Z6_9RHOB|nr:YbhB/YbcL family Raf kinase inhibitor-like protein [Shimia sagamensis]SMP01172.1 hypothetical protein SAMN06265373_101105 [Shimia sagamensis]
MRLPVAIVLTSVVASPAMADFQLSFDGWGDIPSCTSGRPNIVGNPDFVLNGVPEGTKTIQIELTDLDVPHYNHGGSQKLEISGDGAVAAGTFKYKSPCPPNGVHTYQWTATARSDDKILAEATTNRDYPE